MPRPYELLCYLLEDLVDASSSLGAALHKEHGVPAHADLTVSKAMPGLQLQVTASKLAMLKVVELRGLVVSGGCTLKQKPLQDSHVFASGLQMPCRALQPHAIAAESSGEQGPA